MQSAMAATPKARKEARPFGRGPHKSATDWNADMIARTEVLWREHKSGAEIAEILRTEFPERATNLTRDALNYKIRSFGFTGSGGAAHKRGHHRTPRPKGKGAPRPYQPRNRKSDDLPVKLKVVRQPASNLDLSDLLSPRTRMRAEIVMHAKLNGRTTLMTAEEIDVIERRILDSKVTKLPSRMTSDGFETLNRKIAGRR